ncbi:tubulin-folding cofactor C [Carica papaya]|uniref:tubulin-folding cofactor C n=1 Tax=Carica papaya TaxID=3649 RepID=UPI000B8C9212|nr:tubulin-folding cofactor C [Carica papaya]XP_021904271.1 tubulin-folding cofactor C [Carica papaya]XP_021904279.1 tubulin-folding cofactor C [Carica papaya]XP_021904286.1 tubulin-folding cofactor C [Carica papaya]XP_021904294.1 tubulin-folding cofactor C [Carica papaya]XP_021904302.1 tubulin-folding cofactor C [Carica papaya]XP_021904310.1 tubulin-folding cofactor C [Carica papaya]XP_021904316.1 tubulin-folding cofactor C [Carica papaya]XP_021904325.1 tubulin-folding cofactor C [Carica p
MEGAASNLNEPPARTLDPALQKKHLLMLERLSVRHQTRKSNSSNSSSLDSTSSFLDQFAESKRSIESQLAESRINSTGDSTQPKSHLASISSSISDLEKLLAENSYFLPSYEVRSSLKSISDLRQNLENVTNELLPKKKFSFKSKSFPKKSDPKEPEIKKANEILPSNFTVRDSPGFRNKKNEILIQNFKRLEIGEFTLSDLDSCEVRLVGTVNALFVHRLKNCKVYAGPVTGSILIEDVEACSFALASHQIRIHYAKRSDFYLRVRSRPIIEDSNGVRFAPYCLEYEGIEEDLKAAGLDEETGNWAKVDDFRWLRAVQSPNWCIIPEEERAGNVVVVNTDFDNLDS